MGGGGNDIPLATTMKISSMAKSVCEITTKNNIKIGIGFFMNYSESFKLLIITKTNSNNLNEYIEIKGIRNAKIKLNLSYRYIKYINNIIILVIRDSDRLDKYFEFLDYDKDYTKGYNFYNKASIILLKNLFGSDSNNTPSYAKNKIDEIINNEFKHDNSDSIGCPIALSNDNMNNTQVIGIHQNKNSSTKANGIFIGEIIKEIQNDITKIEPEIKAEINIEEKDINQDIRIINSYEEYMTKYYPDELLDQHHINEEEIKQCQIKINNMQIPFSYFYKFPQIGKYNIKYTFINNLKKVNYMFSECSNIINIDLSKFNTKEVDDMSCMFANCCSLQNINLSNINTDNVIDMGCMFYDCNNLTNIDLSSFNTKNVKNMGCLFKGCSSLARIDLSNFNTDNLIDMSCMFKGCTSLTEINLSNFNTRNVINLIGLFQDCHKLTELNLSNFNTKNTTNMNSIFKKCKSLTKIDISNFDSKNVTDMKCMFYECNHIEKRNFITKDRRIFQEFDVKSKLT